MGLWIMLRFTYGLGLAIVFLAFLPGGHAADIPVEIKEPMPNHRAQDHILPSHNDPFRFDQLVKTLKTMELHYEVCKISVGTLAYSVKDIQDTIINIIHSWIHGMSYHPISINRFGLKN